MLTWTADGMLLLAADWFSRLPLLSAVPRKEKLRLLVRDNKVMLACSVVHIPVGVN